jgi:phosphate-selective porin OprO and OprP
MYEDFLWRMEADFRDQEVRLRGAYIEYIRLNPFRIMVGNIKEPMGLEWMTSRRRTTFMERAASLDAYKPSWNIGMRAEYRGSNYNIMAALMSGGELFRQRDVTDGYAFAGRASFSPYNRGTTYTHLAVSGAYRVNSYTQRIDGQFDRQYNPIRLRTRIGTRAIDGRFIGRNDVQDTVDWTRLNAEAAFGFGAFSVQGELTSVNMTRDFGQTDLSLGGYYVQASYFLTGESRTYRPYRGNMGALIPNRNFRPGFGPGAIEIAARFSRVDSNDQDYDGGEMDHFTLGINWYLNREIRVMLNYMYLEAERLNGKQSKGSVVAARFQIEF